MPQQSTWPITLLSLNPFLKGPWLSHFVQALLPFRKIYFQTCGQLLALITHGYHQKSVKMLPQHMYIYTLFVNYMHISLHQFIITYVENFLHNEIKIEIPIFSSCTSADGCSCNAYFSRPLRQLSKLKDTGLLPTCQITLEKSAHLYGSLLNFK